MLRQISRDIEKNFYDPNLHGIDWEGLSAQALFRIENSETPGQMFTAIFWLVDQLKDSHTLFIPPRRAAQVKFGFEAKAFGNEIRIYKLNEDGAAAAAGLQVGDRLLSINGIPAERSNFDLLMLYLRALRPVTIMEISFSRGKEPPRTLKVEGIVKQHTISTDLTTGFEIYELIREAESAIAEEVSVSSENYENSVGYIRLPSFMAEEGRLDHAVKRIRDSRAVVIDLRGNLGGSIENLARFAGYFEEKSTVIAELIGRKKPEQLKTKTQHATLSGPLFILVDSQTASASEIFSRHFQRTVRAVVIGDRTSGRVTAARFFPEKVGVGVIVPFGVEVAVARVVFPGGEELEKRGVLPDRPCIPSAEDLHEGRDVCKQMALALARGSSK